MPSRPPSVFIDRSRYIREVYSVFWKLRLRQHEMQSPLCRGQTRPRVKCFSTAKRPLSGRRERHGGVGVDPVLWTPLKSFSGVSGAAFSSSVSAGVPAADGRVSPIRTNALKSCRGSSSRPRNPSRTGRLGSSAPAGAGAQRRNGAIPAISRLTIWFEGTSSSRSRTNSRSQILRSCPRAPASCVRHHHDLVGKG